eukprot:2976644-Ditylum_brightwellii.AAC.1
MSSRGHSNNNVMQRNSYRMAPDVIAQGSSFTKQICYQDAFTFAHNCHLNRENSCEMRPPAQPVLAQQMKLNCNVIMSTKELT